MTRFLCVSLLMLFAHRADAQWRPSGSIDALVLVETGDELRVGGGLMVDVWEPLGAFQIGLAFGIAAIKSENDDTSQILAPVAVSVGVGVDANPIGFRIYGRGGMWGGATKSGLKAGGFVAGGLMGDVALDDTVSIGLAFEVWRLWGDTNRTALAPSLNLVWRLE